MVDLNYVDRHQGLTERVLDYNMRMHKASEAKKSFYFFIDRFLGDKDLVIDKYYDELNAHLSRSGFSEGVVSRKKLLFYFINSLSVNSDDEGFYSSGLSSQLSLFDQDFNKVKFTEDFLVDSGLVDGGKLTDLGFRVKNEYDASLSVSVNALKNIGDDVSGLGIRVDDLSKYF